MQYIILILLVLIIVYLVILLRKKEIQLREGQAQMSRMQEQIEQTIQTSNDIKAVRDEIWASANTIHLYAALSDEESYSVSIKEKQSEIIRLTEKIMRQIHK
ncbi:MAG: hypothetical protein J6B95_09430 [Oscillospiraceae bacterium]|nr:hypothetical protein [Oscillospiraceae bacterium]